jgi:dihydrodipicolinate synthase/N-acetylneuraminate lyase
MLSTAPSLIRGNWATLLLPLNADDSIDEALLAEELDRFVAARVDGVYSNGSAGEFYTQTEAEFDRISALLAGKCAPAGVPFQIGACHMSPQLSRERIRRTKDLRPTAFQVILPDWFVPTWPELLAFLEAMAAEATPIPLVLYNPPHAKRRLAPAEWQEIAERVPGIVGVKVAAGDDAWYAAMQPVMRRLSVFIPGHLLHEGLARGAHGAYSNVACLSPGGAQGWTELCRRDPSAGARLGARVLEFWQHQIMPLITEQQLSNMAADKAAAVAGGWLPGLKPRVRWPYRSASVEMCAAIGQVARSALPEFFGPA